jgi:hypothetical protein
MAMGDHAPACRQLCRHLGDVLVVGDESLNQ